MWVVQSRASVRGSFLIVAYMRLKVHPVAVSLDSEGGANQLLDQVSRLIDLFFGARAFVGSLARASPCRFGARPILVCFFDEMHSTRAHAHLLALPLVCRSSMSLGGVRLTF